MVDISDVYQKVKIIYRDESIMVIDKPSGLVVNRAKSVKGKTLQDWLEENNWVEKSDDEVFNQRSGLAHRLDKGTSGIILIGRTAKALRFLMAEFKERRVSKSYLALVVGLTPLEGEIEAPIGRDPYNRQRFKVFIGGRQATTYYRLKETYHFQNLDFSLVEVFPRTGRTHQIRVHFRYLGYPLVGDDVYLGRKRIRRLATISPRIFLHASEITFRHPSTKKKVTYHSKLPPDLEEVLVKLSADRGS